MSAVQRQRIRPTTAEHQLLRDVCDETEREFRLAAATITELRERIARAWKWNAFCLVVGFIIGGLAGRAF